MQDLELFSRATTHRDRIAVSSLAGNHTYRDLLERSTLVAGHLLDGRNDLQESRVAFLFPPGFNYIVAQWAIWRAGGIAVPLSLSATESELDYTLGDSSSSQVIVTRDVSSRVESICGRRDLRLVALEDLDPSLATSLPTVDASRRAMILYTSGTTSQPKGVVTTHRNIEAQIRTLVDAWQWQSDDRIPLFLPLHHIHGIINVLSCALWSGATVEPFKKFDLDLILDRVASNAYTLFMAVPTIYVKLIKEIEALAAERREAVIAGFDKMRLMVSGSAALPASIHETWTSLTGQKLLERYGMTEIGMAISNPYKGERRPGAVGQPLPGVEVRLKSDDDRWVTNDDEPGEIQVRGPGVFHEYWNRADATASSFAQGWFRTGDVAVRSAGYYRIMGRQSVDIIKSGGYKLSALEIEAALLEHPSIGECAVVGVPDEMWGELVGVAFVPATSSSETSNDQAGLNLESLQSWCAGRLSKYKIPRRIVQIAALPRNAMGKITKPAVRDLF